MKTCTSCAHVSERVASQQWGRGVVKSFSRYVQHRFPGLDGFSTSNVWRMKQFYETYAGNERLAPLAREITWTANVVIMARAKTDEARQFDLLLYSRELECLVAVELKTDSFQEIEPQDDKPDDLTDDDDADA